MVQVKATPANNRFKDVLATPEEGDGQPLLEPAEDLIPPSSVGQVVPSTGHRQSHRDALAPTTSPAMDLVGVTPVKPTQRSSFIRRMAEGTAAPTSSPLMGKSRLALNELSGLGNVGAASGSLRPPETEANELMATPVKKVAAHLDLGESPVPAPRAAMKPVVSIYQSLGWDDDFDDF